MTPPTGPDTHGKRADELHTPIFRLVLFHSVHKVSAVEFDGGCGQGRVYAVQVLHGGVAPIPVEVLPKVSHGMAARKPGS